MAAVPPAAASWLPLLLLLAPAAAEGAATAPGLLVAAALASAPYAASGAREEESGGEAVPGAVGLGDTGETFIEDGVDKSPVRGDSGSMGLGDDESFKEPDYAAALYGDPACHEAGPEWNEYRRQMGVTYDIVEEDEDTKAALAMRWLFDSGMKEFKRMDREANRCFLGVCATLYHLARHRLMVEGNYHSAAVMVKSLDRYVSSIHPDKFDAANLANTSAPLWPISDALVGRLAREVARASQGRGLDEDCGSPKGCAKDVRPLHGNAFEALPGDSVPLFSFDDPDAQAPLLGEAFKIYVYDVADYAELGRLASGAGFCKDNQWGFEVLLHWYFLACDCRTDDPDEADFFFVPQYTACHLNVNSFTEEESNELFVGLIPKLSHFKRAGGRDHIFVWGGGFAVDGPFRDWEQHIRDSIFLMTETEFWNPYKWQVRPNFKFAKDIVLPGRISVKEAFQHHKLAPPLDQRPYTGDFVGWNRPLHPAQGTAESPRQRLLKWAAKYPDMHIRQDVPYTEALRGSVSSRFCFVPRGKSAWSSRLFRTMFGKCVPVILNDDYELPFLTLFKNRDNWFIRWPMREVNDTFAHMLQELDADFLEQMVVNAEEAKCWYFWHPPVFDAAHYEMQDEDFAKICPEWRTKNAYTAVMALLGQKRRTTKSSFSSFYMPGSVPGEVLYFDGDFAPA